MLKLPEVFISELPIIRVESPKLLSRDKTIEINNKYNNISGIMDIIMSVAKINSRVYEPKIYKEAITDFIHFSQQKDAIEKEIQNLENYQT